MKSDLETMKRVVKFLSVVLLLAVITPHTTAEEFDYAHFGRDWTGTCLTGAAQSPINIVTADAKHVKSTNEYYLKYEADTKVVVANTGHSITLKLSNTSNNFFITPEGKFRLIQFHLHVFSEHSINGLFAPMEIHFVHANADSSHLAVIGIRGRLHPRDEDDPFLNKFFKCITNDTTHHEEVTLNLRHFLQPRGSPMSVLNHYSYPGSLTTPPCNEVVTWYILKRDMKVSVNQVMKIGEADQNIKDANRVNDRLPVPRGNRLLVYRKLY